MLSRGIKWRIYRGFIERRRLEMGASAPTVGQGSPFANGRVENRSLEGLNGSVALPSPDAGFWRHLRAYAGPAFLVSVGYMDPGNWATDLKAGADHRYGLLWVVAAASFMAVIMQILAARLGVVTGKDLAQACRDYYPAWTRWPNWILCELAIVACDLAEVLGSAVALKLLFGWPILTCVAITALDVLLILALQGLGMRFIEAVILVLVATIGGCYFIEIFILPRTQPSFFEMGQALLRPGLREAGMISLAIGIIGATVMPHNLYLHSALVHSRRFPTDTRGLRRALKFNTIDTIVALTVAFFVNAGILVLAAMVFHGRTSVELADGETVYFGADADWIQVAYLTLAPLLGTAIAAVLFAVALFASGQSSTITGTLAGQVVMEGFLHWRMRPWLRRLITRSLAIVPALLIVGYRGERSITSLLLLSQIVLGLQLPFAMIPLLHFTSSRKRMGDLRNGWFLLPVGWACCLLITALIIYGFPDAVQTAWNVIVGVD
jgi:manganese transport protein